MIIAKRQVVELINGLPEEIDINPMWSLFGDGTGLLFRVKYLAILSGQRASFQERLTKQSTTSV